jgi:hypothetical protein
VRRRRAPVALAPPGRESAPLHYGIDSADSSLMRWMRIRLLPRRRWLRRIVIGIGVSTVTLAIALLILIPSIGCRPSRSRSTESQERTIRAAIQNWQAATNLANCPTVEQLVSEKQLDPGTSARDAWGHPFVLKCTDEEVYVTSLGPDGKPNTADDIRIPKIDPDDTKQVATPTAGRDAGRVKCGPLVSCVGGTK